MSRISADLVNREGLQFGSVLIAPRKAAWIAQLEEGDAMALGEERVQLREGSSYEYALVGVPAGAVLRESSVIQPGVRRKDEGRIETGQETGLLPLILVDGLGFELARGGVEVTSTKLDYRTDYRAMMDSVAEVTTGLLMDIRGSAQARMSADLSADTRTLHQRLAVLRNIITNRDLEDGVRHLLASPHRRFVSEPEIQDIRRGIRASGNVQRQLASGWPRLPVPPRHRLKAVKPRGIDSVPARLERQRGSETLDTAENRFVKHALTTFESFLVDAERRFSRTGGLSEKRLAEEIRPLTMRVSTWLGHELFRDVGDVESIPLGSPVLQQRSGYRDVLRAWLQFQLATRLNWSGGDDVFGAGKRDTATLYEYWVFFELLRLANELFQLEGRPSDELIESTTDGFDLRLKSGKHLKFFGTYSSDGEGLRVQFSYNRTFARSGDAGKEFNYPAPGSWTRSMRPDYTFSLWPAEFDMAEAERQELMVHVHFDAKYRVDDLVGLFGTDSEDDLVAEKDAQRRGTIATRSDLLKMHAYRDAIRRTEGAYVIYPGTNPLERQDWVAFHEILPGLGAFSLKPTSAETSLTLLRDFLIDVADFTCNRSSRLDQQTYHTFRIQEESGRYRSNPALPEIDDAGEPLRRQPPSEAN